MSLFRTLILSLSILIIQSSFAQSPCLPEGLWITSQQQIDSFPINYPGCSNIEGSVIISLTDINDLSGLNQIKSIGGNLNISSNHLLPDFTGLENLDSIYGSFEIAHNNAVTDMSGFSSLSYVGQFLGIVGNSSLVYLNGLDSLSHIGGDIRISLNESLTNFTGLNSVTTCLGWYFEIEGNSNLLSFDGLNSLDSINSVMWIINNPLLESLYGLDNLTYVGTHLEIAQCHALTNLNGLNSLKIIEEDEVYGGLYIHSNDCFGSNQLGHFLVKY